MENNTDLVDARVEEEYGQDPDYIYQMAFVHNGEVHPCGVFTELPNAKEYVRRTVVISNARNDGDESQVPIPYADEMWIKEAEGMYAFVLGQASWYRVVRFKLNDYSYLESQEQELAFDSDSPSGPLTV